MRRISLPWPWLALLVLALALSFAQGLRLASERQQSLEPAPVLASLQIGCEKGEMPGEAVIAGGTDHGVLGIERACPTPVRLGLVQIFPERSLLRWVEPAPSRRALHLPLAGLEEGRYALVALAPETAAQPREMDRPPESLDVRAAFVLVTGGEPR